MWFDLDGYYLLSDFLEIPNLRRKSFRSVGALVRQLVGRPFQSEGETKRKRRLYLTYGIIATGGSLILMGSLLVTAFRHLGDGSQSMILAVPVTAGLMIRGRRSFVRVFAGAANSNQTIDDDLNRST